MNEFRECPYCGAPQGETVSLGAINAARKNGKKIRSARRTFLRVCIIILSVLLALAVAAVTFAWFFLDQNIQHGSELDESNLAINEELPETGIMTVKAAGREITMKLSASERQAKMLLAFGLTLASNIGSVYG